jgi:alkylation response protein AidB-like acyl-CoA dehydrogenase
METGEDACVIVNLTQEERDLRDAAREFGTEYIEPDAMEYVNAGEWPWDVFEAAAAADLIGLPFDEAYGGRNASLVEGCLVAQEFCRADSSVGIALHGSTVGCHAVSAYGTHDQKERWLQPVTEGEITTSIALTEPDTGSALSEVTTTAEKDGDEYVINGEKDWIANGASSAWAATLCRTDPDPDEPHRGLSLIVVPTDADGYEAEPRQRLGLDAAEHARVSYDGVRVPQANLLGEEEGNGFYQTLEWLEHGRVDIAAAHLGMAEGAFDRALAYAKERKQGGQPIGDYQGLRWKLADMRKGIEVANSQVYRAARLVEEAEAGEVDASPIEQASIAKLYATEMACDVAEEAVQIFGGAGFARENEVEHFYRDVKAGTIYEGTSEVQRNTIGKVLFDEL